jgi:hypothetical protein
VKGNRTKVKVIEVAAGIERFRSVLLRDIGNVTEGCVKLEQTYENVAKVLRKNSAISGAETECAKQILTDLVSRGGDSISTIRRHKIAVVDIIKNLAFEFLNRTYRYPTKILDRKKMKGIWRREFWFYPASSANAINRRGGKVAPLKVTNSMHSFEDIGQSPMLRHRFKSCHQCEGCMLGDAPSCENLAVTGPVSVTELSFESGANVEMAVTRYGVERIGRARRWWRQSTRRLSSRSSWFIARSLTSLRG